MYVILRLVASAQIVIKLLELYTPQYYFSNTGYVSDVIHIQSSLFIHGFYICKFTYSLRFICNPPIKIRGASVVICGHV